MGTIVVLMGGMIATLISLVAVFAGGVNWGTGLMIYLSSGLSASLLILTLAMIARKRHSDGRTGQHEKLAA